jgi:hypothetical protein
LCEGMQLLNYVFVPLSNLNLYFADALNLECGFILFFCGLVLVRMSCHFEQRERSNNFNSVSLLQLNSVNKAPLAYSEKAVYQNPFVILVWCGIPCQFFPEDMS